MTQPAKGQEPSMEEILASIRRIIADEPAKTPSNDSSRADDLRGEGPRIVGGRSDAARRALQSRGLSGPSDGLDTAVRRISQSDSAEHDRALPQAPSAVSQPSRMFPEDRPSMTFGRAAMSPPASPPPEPGMQQEEIEAFLAELGGDSADASDVLADSTEPVPTAECLPEPEFATSDHVVQPTSDEDEEEQSRTELEQALERAIASRPMMRQPEPQAQVPRYAQRLHEPEISDEALISANTTAAVNSAFNTLAQTVLVQNGRTLEDLVREMLRPMLKVWLDDNLPGMVERLVRVEIERVSRGRA